MPSTGLDQGEKFMLCDDLDAMPCARHLFGAFVLGALWLACLQGLCTDDEQCGFLGQAGFDCDANHSGRLGGLHPRDGQSAREAGDLAIKGTVGIACNGERGFKAGCFFLGRGQLRES